MINLFICFTVSGVHSIKVLNEKMKNAKDDKEKNELLEKFNKKIIDIINAYLSTH